MNINDVIEVLCSITYFDIDECDNSYVHLLSMMDYFNYPNENEYTVKEVLFLMFDSCYRGFK